MYLRCAVHNTPTLWKQWLPLAELWYNSSFHTSLGCSPFKALYGHEPNLGVIAASTEFAEADTSVQEILQERDAHITVLKEHLAAAQNRMKLQADKKRTDKQYQVGEQILLKLQPYVQSSLVNRPYPKLAYKYFGPYSILERVGAAAYKLNLPPDSKVHNVFHVSQLKPFVPDHSPVFSDLTKLVDLSSHVTEPETVLDRRLVKRGNTAIPQVLIKWTALPAESATWEDFYVVKQKFPASAAWGQVSAEGGEAVTTVTGGTA